MRRPSKAREARAAIDLPQAAEVKAAADEGGIDKDRRGGDVGRWSVGEEGEWGLLAGSRCTEQAPDLAVLCRG